MYVWVKCTCAHVFLVSVGEHMQTDLQECSMPRRGNPKTTQNKCGGNAPTTSQDVRLGQRRKAQGPIATNTTNATIEGEPGND